MSMDPYEQPYPQQPYQQQPYPQSYPQQPYPQPYQQPYPPAFPQQQRTNGLCVAGMICGIVSLCGFWVPFGGIVVAIVGAILSGVGMRQVSENPMFGGKGMGIAGLICSLLALVPAVIIVVLFFVGLAAAGSACAVSC